MTIGQNQLTKGHSKSHGGLRGHSIGEHYPVTVSYEGIIGKGMWVVWNTLTNAVYGRYFSCKYAHTQAGVEKARL